jgi:hypothetical protein
VSCGWRRRRRTRRRALTMHWQQHFLEGEVLLCEELPHCLLRILYANHLRSLIVQPARVQFISSSCNIQCLNNLAILGTRNIKWSRSYSQKSIVILLLNRIRTLKSKGFIDAKGFKTTCFPVEFIFWKIVFIKYWFQ